MYTTRVQWVLKQSENIIINVIFLLQFVWSCNVLKHVLQLIKCVVIALCPHSNHTALTLLVSDEPSTHI